MADPHELNWGNLVRTTISGSFTSSDTILNVAAGTGSRFPNIPFRATIWNSTDYTDPALAYWAGEAEIIECPSRSTDALTVIRGAEGSTPINSTAGKTYSIIVSLTEDSVSNFLTIVNVRSYGATGDGVIDDGPAFNLALTAANGGIVIVPPGDYRIQTQIVMSVDGAQLIGSQFTNQSSLACRLFVPSAITAIKMTNYGQRISNLFIRGQTTATSGIWVQNGARSIIENVACTYFTSHGIIIDNDSTGSNNYLILRRCKCEWNGGSGIAIPYFENDAEDNAITIEVCTSEHNTGHGLLLKQCGQRVAGGTYSYNGGYGILVGEASDPNSTNRCIISYPWTEDNTSGGVHMSSKAFSNLYFSLQYEPSTHLYTFTQDNDSNLVSYMRSTGTSDPGGIVVAEELTSGADTETVIFKDHIQLNYEQPNVQEITASGASTTIDLSAGYDIELTLATATTALTLNNPVDGVRYYFRVAQDATGARTISDWAVGQTVVWTSDGAPDISGMTANQVRHVCFKYEDSKFRGEYGKVYSS